MSAQRRSGVDAPPPRWVALLWSLIFVAALIVVVFTGRGYEISPILAILAAKGFNVAFAQPTFLSEMRAVVAVVLNASQGVRRARRSSGEATLAEQPERDERLRPNRDVEAA